MILQILAACASWRPRSAAAALPPTPAQLQIAAAARAVKVYVYDPASAGVQPPLTSFASDSAVCKDSCRVRPRPGGVIDLCNHAFGRTASKQFARAMQGNVWVNHDYGHDVALQVCTRWLQWCLAFYQSCRIVCHHVNRSAHICAHDGRPDCSTPATSTQVSCEPSDMVYTGARAACLLTACGTGPKTGRSFLHPVLLVAIWATPNVSTPTEVRGRLYALWLDL